MIMSTQLGSNDLAYEIIFFLHILSAIVGFGTVFLNSMYGRQALDRRGREGAAIGQATLAVGNVAEIFIYAVFVTGLLMGIMADDGSLIELSDAWLSAAMLLYIIALGITHGVLKPSVKKLNAALAATADAQAIPQGAESSSAATPEVQIDGLNKKVASASGALNVLMIVILVLMVWKPGI